MDNLKNFVVNKGLEVADSINTGFITLNGKSVSGLVDSSNVLGLIYSAYVQARSPASGNDSATTIALIDSAYVQARQTKYTNADFTDSAFVTTQINSVIDAAPGALDTLNELAAALGDDANFSTTITNQIAAKLDSAQAIAIVDSSYVQARVTASSGNDSATTIALVDSSYVQARQITPVSAFNTITVATQNDVVSDTTAISYENTAQQAILQASNRGQDYFGQRVAIDNGYAIVNADNEDTGGSNAGSVYVYVRSGTTWSQQQQITSPISPPDNHYFGTDLDIEGSRIVIGTKYDDTDYNHGGGVHVYTRSGTTWSLEQRLASSDIAANDWFGDRVAISGNYIVASAHKKNSSEGAVYVFKGATSTTLQGASYDSVQSVSLNAIETQPRSMLFNSDGTKVYIVGMSSDAIKQYSLATPYDISTNFLSNASSSYSLTISGQNNMGIYAMRWNNDGTKVYVLCNNNMKIYQHDLTTAYDISTASYSNKNFSTTTQENNYAGFTFNNDGTSMYLCGAQNNKVFQYTLSTAYDISTASYASKSFTPSGSHGGTTAIQFDESGKKLFILGNSLRQHDLTTAFDVSSSISVSYAINILTNATQAGDFTFNADMSKLYAVEPGADKIFQFSTSGASTVWVQQAKLLASDNTTGDKFGFDVAIDGDTIAIGAAVADTGGKVYAFTRSGTTWSQQAAFTSSDISSEDEFGGSVSISGDTILVGAYSAGGTSSAPHGAAYVFTRSGSTWSQQAKIQPSDTPNPSSATIAFAYRQLAIENDIAIIGHSTATLDGTANVGAAYLFKRSGTTWTQVNKFGASDATASDGFGHGVDIDGRDIIVGAPSENSGKGQAYTFVVPDAAIYSDTLTLAGGSGITLTSNATTDTVTIAAAAAGNDSATTIALIDSSYVQARQITPISSFNTISVSSQTNVVADPTVTNFATTTQAQKLTASDAASSDFFGNVVDIDGDYAVAGARGNKAVYVYYYNGTTWSEQQKIQQTAFGSNFGHAVSVVGDTLLVGSNNTDGSNADGTKAYVYTRSGTTWSLQQKVDPSQALENDYFGYQKTLKLDNTDNNQFIAGSYGEDETNSNEGAVYIFNRSGTTWSETQRIVPSDKASNSNFGVSVDIAGDYAIFGGNNAVYVYYKSGGTWSQQQKIANPYEAGNGHSGPTNAVNFGTDGEISINAAGDTIAVGARGQSNLPGYVFVFTRSGTTWTLQQALRSSNTANEDFFGWSVSLDGTGNSLTVGAKTTSTGGKAYIFTRTGTTWTEVKDFTASDVAANWEFGEGIGISRSNDKIIVGARQNSSSTSGTGAVYIFNPGSTATYSDTLTLEAGTGITLTTAAGTDTVTITGSAADELISIDSDLTSTDSDQVIHSFSKTSFRTMKYIAQLKHAGDNAYHSEEILLTHNGTNVVITSYAKLLLDSDLGEFDAAINGSNVELRLTPTKTNTNVKLKAISTTV